MGRHRLLTLPSRALLLLSIGMSCFSAVAIQRMFTIESE